MDSGCGERAYSISDGVPWWPAGATTEGMRGSQSRVETWGLKLSPAEIKAIELAFQSDRGSAESARAWARNLLLAFAPDLANLRFWLNEIEDCDKRAAGARQAGAWNREAEDRRALAREALINCLMMMVAEYERPGQRK